MKMKSTSAQHSGFKAVTNEIASKGDYSVEAARGILAAKTRSASPAAKKKNPNLKKVPGNGQ